MKLQELHLLGASTLVIVIVLAWVCDNSYAPFWTYLFVGSSLYWTHRLGHAPWTGPWYRSHQGGHHEDQYPPEKRDSSEYRVNARDTWNLNTWMYALTASLTLTALALVLQWTLWDSIIQTLFVLVMLLLESDAHERMHLTSAQKCVWINAGEWNLLKINHRMHHSHRPGNYGITHSLLFDVLFGTNKMKMI